MGSRVQEGKWKGGAVLEGLPITPEGVPRYGRIPGISLQSHQKRNAYCDPADFFKICWGKIHGKNKWI